MSRVPLPGPGSSTKSPPWFLGAVAQVGQAAAARGVADADAVVADVEGDPVVVGGEVDVGGVGAGVPGDVAQRLAQHGEQIVADVRSGKGVEQAGEADGGVEPQGRGRAR